MRDEDIPPERLSGINPTEPEKIARLASRMRADGWGSNRRLLIEEVLHDYDPFPRQGLVAWTGSHRIEAAKSAELKTIPCMVMTAAEMKHHFARYKDRALKGYGSFRDTLYGARGNDGKKYENGDAGRLRALEEAGFAEAAQMMSEEIAAEDG